MQPAEAVASYIRMRQGDLAELDVKHRQELIYEELKDKLAGWSPADIETVTEAAADLLPEAVFDEPRLTSPSAPEPRPPELDLDQLVTKLAARLESLPAEAQSGARVTIASQLGFSAEPGTLTVETFIEALKQVGDAARGDPDRGVPQGDRITVEQQVVEQIIRRLQGLKSSPLSGTTAAAVMATLAVELCAQNVLAHKLLEQLDRHALDPVRGRLRSANKFAFPALLERMVRDGSRGRGLADFRTGLRSSAALPKALLNVYPEAVDEFRGRMIELEPAKFEKTKGIMFRSVDYEDAWNRFRDKYREFIDDSAEDWGERSKQDLISKVLAFLGDYYGWD